MVRSQSLPPAAICPVLAGSGGCGVHRAAAAAALLEMEEAVVVEGVADVAAGHRGRMSRRLRASQPGLPPDGLPVALVAFGFAPLARPPGLLRRFALPPLLLLELGLADDVLQRSRLPLLPLLRLLLRLRGWMGTLLPAGFDASLPPRAPGLVGRSGMGNSITDTFGYSDTG